jgi:hypothetical protein
MEEVFYARKCSVEFVSVFSSRGLLVETLNNTCSTTYSRSRFCFRLLVAALREVKETKRMH